MIPGTAALAAEVLGVEARVGIPTGLGGGMVKEVSDPKFATAVGLVLYGLRPSLMGREFLAQKERWSAGPAHTEESGARRIVERMTRWFQEL
jgi:cell division protein FtsA